MKEHLDEKYIDLDSLDDGQLMAHYFRNFDLDKDGKVDALEMYKYIRKMNRERIEKRAYSGKIDIFYKTHQRTTTTLTMTTRPLPKTSRPSTTSSATTTRTTTAS